MISFRYKNILTAISLASASSLGLVWASLKDRRQFRSPDRPIFRGFFPLSQNLKTGSKRFHSRIIRFVYRSDVDEAIPLLAGFVKLQFIPFPFLTLVCAVKESATRNTVCSPIPNSPVGCSQEGISFHGFLSLLYVLPTLVISKISLLDMPVP